jgi:hypothetical protein
MIRLFCHNRTRILDWFSRFLLMFVHRLASVWYIFSFIHRSLILLYRTICHGSIFFIPIKCIAFHNRYRFLWIIRVPWRTIYEKKCSTKRRVIILWWMWDLFHRIRLKMIPEFMCTLWVGFENRNDGGCVGEFSCW